MPALPGVDNAGVSARALAIVCAIVIGLPAALGPAAAARAWSDTMAQRALACTACHGEQGQATAEGFVPRLAGKPAGYLFDQMRAFRDGRRAHRGMARLMETLDDEQLRALADHFAGLVLPHPAPAAAAPVGAAARRAQQIVRQGLPEAGVPACTACHGDALTGRNPQVPGLLGLPRGYLLSQLGAWRNGTRHGREPDCMATVARRLPAADLPLLAGWLAAQTVPADAAPAAIDAPPGPPVPELRCAEPARRDAITEAAPADDGPIARGAYLARVANCAGCHRRPGTEELSGGPGLVTPFGVAHAGNLTPDPDTGLGRWSADDFWRALHEGRGRDGWRLLPAFPYPSYTHMSRADSDALFAWLRTLPPVARRRPAHELRFPYGTQPALALWQWLFFRPAPQTTGAPADPLFARGRYLVEGPGHCLECHAPRGRWAQRGADPSGGLMPGGDWWAPSLHPTPGRREEDLVALLRDGRDRHGSVVGPMAVIVGRSTRHWRDADLRAAARYLMSLPPQPPPRSAGAAPAERLALGRRLYDDRCAHCHGANGEGAGAGPLPAIAPLAGNPVLLQPKPHSLVQMLRYGGFGARTAGHPRPFGMPPALLDVKEEAALLSWMRQAWGHRAGPVGEADLHTLD
jgi:cytochrome c553